MLIADSNSISRWIFIQLDFSGLGVKNWIYMFIVSSLNGASCSERSLTNVCFTFFVSSLWPSSDVCSILSRPSKSFLPLAVHKLFLLLFFFRQDACHLNHTDNVSATLSYIIVEQSLLSIRIRFTRKNDHMLEILV